MTQATLYIVMQTNLTIRTRRDICRELRKALVYRPLLLPLVTDCYQRGSSGLIIQIGNHSYRAKS